MPSIGSLFLHNAVHLLQAIIFKIYVWKAYNIPTQALWSSFGTSSPMEHITHLSSKSSIESLRQVQSSSFSEVGTLSPGQMPKMYIKLKLKYCYVWILHHLIFHSNSEYQIQNITWRRLSFEENLVKFWEVASTYNSHIDH